MDSYFVQKIAKIILLVNYSNDSSDLSEKNIVSFQYHSSIVLVREKVGRKNFLQLLCFTEAALSNVSREEKKVNM